MQSRRIIMATVPYYILYKFLLSSFVLCMLPPGEQNLSAWSKKYVQVDALVAQKMAACRKR